MQDFYSPSLYSHVVCKEPSTEGIPASSSAPLLLLSYTIRKKYLRRDVQVILFTPKFGTKYAFFYFLLDA